MKRILAVVLTLIMVLALLSGCAGQTPANQSEAPASQSESDNTASATDGIKTGGTIIIGQSAEPITLNPDGKTDGSMDIVAQNVFSRLLKTNNNEEIILDLATGYSVSDDHRLLCQRRRPDLHLHAPRKRPLPRRRAVHQRRRQIHL